MRTTGGVGRTTAKPLALPRRSGPTPGEMGGAWVTGLPVATGSSGWWGWQPSWSQAAVPEEVGGDARTSDLQVPTGSLHRVRGWGTAPPGWADYAKWAELRGLQSWGAPGWGGHGGGKDAQVWVSLGIRGLPCLAQKATVHPKSCAMGTLALMSVRGPLCSSLAWARLLQGLSEFTSPSSPLLHSTSFCPDEVAPNDPP